MTVFLVTAASAVVPTSRLRLADEGETRGGGGEEGGGGEVAGVARMHRGGRGRHPDHVEPGAGLPLGPEAVEVVEAQAAVDGDGREDLPRILSVDTVGVPGDAG